MPSAAMQVSCQRVVVRRLVACDARTPPRRSDVEANKGPTSANNQAHCAASVHQAAPKVTRTGVIAHHSLELRAIGVIGSKLKRLSSSYSDLQRTYNWEPGRILDRCDVHALCTCLRTVRAESKDGGVAN